MNNNETHEADKKFNCNWFVISFEEMSHALNSLGVSGENTRKELEKNMYLLGIIPLPRHLRAWHVARKYKELS